ncbi:MAG: HlyD family type I secretion periplasmic adaptor subunit [Veillonellaceae bacterium]|nr:HlyD family type I secretion periplasmic adaptor subunit [Veillonellaceae bacterium]
MKQIKQKLQQWLQWGKQLAERFDQAQRERDENEFLPAVLEVTETPPSPIARIILWTLMALLVVGGLWTLLGHVDEVAVAPGKIIPRGQVKVIQSEYKGSIKSIKVKDGQLVKAGDVLIELDQTVSAADLSQMRKQVNFYRLQLERLEAEQLGLPFQPQVTADMDPVDVATQKKLFDSRTTEIRHRLSQSAAKIAEQRAQLLTAETNLRKYTELLAIAVERERRMQELLQENAVSLFAVLEYQSKRIELEQNAAAQQSEIQRVSSALQQSMQEWAGIKSERDKEIATKVVDDRKQLRVYEEELKKAEQKNRQSTLVAPVDGRVAQLSVHTVGGVVTEAQALLVVVPDGTTMEVEAWAANKDIGFLRVGQPAEVKIETFNFQRYGTIDATVTEISADATEDKAKGLVYRMVLRLERQDVDVSGQNAPLSPGMSATAEIKIRQKRIIEFFLDPFRKYKSEALRER